MSPQLRKTEGSTRSRRRLPPRLRNKYIPALINSHTLCSLLPRARWKNTSNKPKTQQLAFILHERYVSEHRCRASPFLHRAHYKVLSSSRARFCGGAKLFSFVGKLSPCALHFRATPSRRGFVFVIFSQLANFEKSASYGILHDYRKRVARHYNTARALNPNFMPRRAKLHNFVSGGIFEDVKPASHDPNLRTSGAHDDESH